MIDDDPPLRMPARADVTDRAPPPTMEAIRKSVRPFLPWWRRLGGWVIDLHKGVVALTGLVVVGTAINVGIRGIVTVSLLDATVQTAVEKAMRIAMAEQGARILNLETHVSDLPSWRGSYVTPTLVSHETRIIAAEKLEDKTEKKVDDYMMGRGRR